MSLKTILVICCLVEMFFAAPSTRSPYKFTRKLIVFKGKITTEIGHMKNRQYGNCSDAKVRAINFHSVSCSKVAYENTFCQIYSALKLVNTSMCKNLSEIYPGSFLLGNDIAGAVPKCNLSTDSITMKEFLPKVKHYAQRLYENCATTQE